MSNYIRNIISFLGNGQEPPGLMAVAHDKDVSFVSTAIGDSVALLQLNPSVSSKGSP